MAETFPPLLPKAAYVFPRYSPYDEGDGQRMSHAKYRAAWEARQICTRLSAGGIEPDAGTLELARWTPPLRKIKRSSALSAKEVRRLYGSVAFANYCGTLMNTFTTIAWSTVGVSTDEEVQRANAKFLDHFRRWCLYRQLPCHHVWVVERGRRLGLHLHILAHVPHIHATRYASWALRKVGKLSGQEPLCGKAVEGKPPLSTLHIGDRQMDIDDQWGAFRYMIKGVGPEEVQTFVGRHYHSLLVSEFAELKCSDQGLVTGPRSGRSQALADGDQSALFAQLGKPSFWPDARATASKLHYGSSFLHEGEMRRQLQCLDI